MGTLPREVILERLKKTKENLTVGLCPKCSKKLEADKDGYYHCGDASCLFSMFVFADLEFTPNV